MSKLNYEDKINLYNDRTAGMSAHSIPTTMATATITIRGVVFCGRLTV